MPLIKALCTDWCTTRHRTWFSVLEQQCVILGGAFASATMRMWFATRSTGIMAATPLGFPGNSVTIPNAPVKKTAEAADTTSTQPGKGSLKLAPTMLGRTINTLLSGKDFAWLSMTSAMDFVNVYVLGYPVSRRTCAVKLHRGFLIIVVGYFFFFQICNQPPRTIITSSDAIHFRLPALPRA